LKGGAKSVLLPIPFAKVDFKAKRVNVQALLGDQINGVPGLGNADRVTLLEEEKITAYYGAGTLYATPDRAGPLL
jgi:photosynthetic reaction center H subunit